MNFRALTKTEYNKYTLYLRHLIHQCNAFCPRIAGCSFEYEIVVECSSDAKQPISHSFLFSRKTSTRSLDKQLRLMLDGTAWRVNTLLVMKLIIKSENNKNHARPRLDLASAALEAIISKLNELYKNTRFHFSMNDLKIVNIGFSMSKAQRLAFRELQKNSLKNKPNLVSEGNTTDTAVF